MKKIPKHAETVTVGVFGFLLCIVLMIPFSFAATVNPGVFPADSKPYGHSYGEWAAKWYKWFMEIPADANHPFSDITGVNCARYQSGPVWFLVGSGGTPVYRNCVIPAGKALAFNAISTECSYAENELLKTEADLRSCAINGDRGGTAQLTIDGIPVQSVQNYTVQSPIFNFTFPKNNVYGANPGPSQSVVHCYCFVVKPLPQGEHDIHFRGYAKKALGATTDFASDATYHLVVK